MKNRTNTRRCGRPYNGLSAKTLILAGFAVIISLGISSLALHTRPAATQELDKNMPTLKGDAAVDLLKKDKTYGSLEEAIAEATKGDNPEAVVKLTAPDARTNDYFGSSVAISGDTLIVGAHQLRQGNGGNLRGAAYIFIRNGSGWSFQQKLTGDGSGGPDGFGVGVAISGDTVVVAAPDEDLGDDYDGVAYVFVRNGTTWSLQKKLTPADTPLVEGEGWYQGSVAISGDTILVGSQGLLEFSDHETMVHVFVREGTTWMPQAVLTSIDEGQDVRFGHSVAISGDIAVVGDPYVQNGSPHMESTYIFVRCGTTWTRQQRLTPNDGPGDRQFGGSVAISGNTVIIGAESDRPSPLNQQGAAYIFASDGTTWTQQQKLTAIDSGTSSRFGSSVAVMGDTAIVGKDRHATEPFNRGFAFVYQRIGTAWALQETLTASDGVTGDSFGSSVAISESVVLVGAIGDDFGAAQNSEGSAYAIDRTTVAPPPSSPPCDDDIEVNITTDQPDIDIEDDVCDVDMGQSGNQCSLRAAIQTANAKEGPDEILFSIPGGGVKTISPGSALPNITEKVVIDGTTQSGYAGMAPMVEVEGTIVGGGGRGLVFSPGSDESQVKALTVNRFRAVGVELQSNDNVIEKCYIGLGNDGLITFDGLLGQQDGIEITGARNRIGRDDRTDTVASNYISGNLDSQITIRSPSAFENLIIGNDIGALVDGTIFEGSIGVDGIEIIEGANRNQIGGDSHEEHNAISGILAGVGIRNSNGTIITRNFFQACITGIFVLSSTDTVIGGTSLRQENGQGNRFDMNEISVRVDYEYRGPQLPGPPSRNTRILGNLFRVSDPGMVPEGNPTTAIGVANAEDTLIGSEQPGFENYIGDSTNAGIIIRKEAVRTIVRRNFLGLNFDEELHPNRVGIFLGGNGSQVITNRVAHSTEIGIAIDRFEDGDPLPMNNSLTDNRIGTNSSGTAGLPNETGVVIEGHENIVTSNIISGNSIVGLTVFGDRNTISQNKIGTDITGTIAIPNLAGVSIAGSQNTLLRNTVSGNTFGIQISPFPETGPIPTGNLIKGNFVGTNSTGDAALQNTLTGILLNNARTTLIGGLGPNIPTDRNIISGNGSNGISLVNGSTQNRISGNYIGTTANGESPLGNSEHGIRVGTSCSNTIIGGPEENSGNTIAFNGHNGIALANDAGNNNIIDPNRIFGNVLAGIDIGENGFTPNDPMDADIGPNKLQNYPTFTLSLVGGDLIVSYQVDSAPQHSTYGGTGIYVEFFEADSTGAGRDFLGSDPYLLSDYQNGTPGTRQKNLGNAVALGIVAGDKLTATATDAEGNSSEFTPAVIVPGGAPGFEADVAPRPNGDGNMLSTDITQMRRFVSGLDTPNPATNEAQRIDCAPRSTFGDGIVNSSDVVQGRRYVSGLDVITPAGGPANRVDSVPESIFVPNRDSGLDLFQRELNIGEPEFRRSTVIVPIELTSQGNEVAMSFTLEYDHSVLANPRITLGKFAPAGSTLTVNTTEPGRIGILIDSANAMTASAVPLNIATVSFEVKGEASGEAPIYLTGSLAATGISDAFGNSLPTKYLDGVVRMNEKSALINRFFSLFTLENVFGFGA